MLLKGIALWVSVILSIVPVLYSFLEPLSKGAGDSLAEHFFDWSTLSVIASFIPVCAYTTAALFSRNTIQDVISKGYSLKQIYIAKTLVNTVFCTIVFFLNIFSVYLFVHILGSIGNEILFENIPTKLLMTLPVCLFYSVLATDLSFLIKKTFYAVIASYLTLTVFITYLIGSLSRLVGTVYGDENLLSFFSNSFFEVTYFSDNLNAYFLPVSGIYLVLTIITFFIGILGFNKADLK
jgi:ABC-type transport system involved in multi-copper enzyme maturation permease subunit